MGRSRETWEKLRQGYGSRVYRDPVPRPIPDDLPKEILEWLGLEQKLNESSNRSESIRIQDADAKI